VLTVFCISFVDLRNLWIMPCDRRLFQSLK